MCVRDHLAVPRLGAWCLVQVSHDHGAAVQEEHVKVLYAVIYAVIDKTELQHNRVKDCRVPPGPPACSSWCYSAHKITPTSSEIQTQETAKLSTISTMTNIAYGYANPYRRAELKNDARENAKASKIKGSEKAGRIEPPAVRAQTKRAVNPTVEKEAPTHKKETVTRSTGGATHASFWARLIKERGGFA